MVKEPIIMRVILFVLRAFGRLADYLERKLPLYRYVVVMSFIFLSLPVISVWTIFIIANYLPNPFRAILIWSLILTITLICAVIDYIKTH